MHMRRNNYSAQALKVTVGVLR